MPTLKNNRHEIFAQSLVKGMTQKDAAIEAGYEPKAVDVTASRLLRNAKICERISELQGRAVSKSVLSVLERKEILSEMARANVGDFMVMSEDGRDIQFVPKIANSPAVSYIRTEQIALGRMPVKVVRLGLVDKARAIAELNKMERVYEPEGGTTIDNRTVNIIVASEEDKKKIERVISGERT